MKRIIAYSLKEIIKEYIDISDEWQLCAHMQHGFYMKDELTNWYLDPNAAFMLVWNRRMERMWKGVSRIPVAISGAPFVLYRRMKGLVKDSTAQGTIVFPHHSTENVSSNFDIEAYCRQLLSLGGDFRPVTVCLYNREYSKTKSEYQKYGFNVVTAGPPSAPDFVQRFYALLLKNKYATSNDVGSAAFYAVEAGIPFFILGPRPKLVHRKTDSEIQLGAHYESVCAVFKECDADITPEASELVKKECGISDAVDPQELKRQLFNIPGAVVPA